MLHFIPDLWDRLVDWVAVHAAAPSLAFLHIHENARDVSEAALVTLLQISIIAFIFRPLESILPAEEWTHRRHTKIDRLYTLVMLLGLFPLFSYLVLAPFGNLFGAGDAVSGDSNSALNVRHLVPWFDAHPMALLAVYYVLYDLTYYWMHRAQHLIPWWWALHSMHHSQRQMSCWTNDRSHYLDGMMQSIILALVGIVMGIDIGDFAWLTLISELVQNFSHANVRVGFGKYFEKLFVDPKFHRLHHMKVDITRPNLHNCNFGQVLSIWDTIFGTALYGEAVRPTGVGDPLIDADNERGLVGMQWHTLKRFWGAFRRRSGWRIGDVTFGPDYEPIPLNYGKYAAQPSIQKLDRLEIPETFKAAATENE